MPRNRPLTEPQERAWRILRNGEEVGVVWAVGMLSALVRFGALRNPIRFYNAEWTVERVDE